MSQHLLFDAAGMSLAAPANHVKSVHDVLKVQPVAGTRPWFLGLAVAGGKLLPVTDIGVFAGRHACSGRTLELEPTVAIAALRVDRVFGFSDILPADIAPEKNEMECAADVNLTLAEQAIVDNEHVFRILDIAALVQTPVFINIREV
jgi:chemotaxis signal transduction protein